MHITQSHWFLSISNLNVWYAARVSITRIDHKKMGNDLEIKCVSFKVTFFLLAYESGHFMQEESTYHHYFPLPVDFFVTTSHHLC